MGIFDGYQFGDSDQGSLIDRLFAQLGVQNQYQPSAGFGPNPMNAQAAMPAQQNAPIAVGDYQMPRIGSGFSPNIAPQEAPGTVPQQRPDGTLMQQPMAQPGLPAALQPYHAPGGLSGAFQGAAANLQGGPLGMLFGGIGGALGMGQGSEQTQANRTTAEMYKQLVPILGEQKATLAVLNPTLGQKMVETALAGKQYGFQMLPDGTMVRTDARAGTVAPVYSGAAKPTFGVVDETDGKKTYGWIDPNKRAVTPYEGAGGAEDRNTVTGPDGKLIQIPPGADRKTFVNEISKTNADAATGKMTESQAKSSTYAARMELAESILKNTQNTGAGFAGTVGRTLDSIPIIGGSAATNLVKPESVQKYTQARDNFIAALLRQESGAAIGKSEYEAADKQYFPQPGDSEAVIKQKAKTRAVAIEQMKRAAGPGYKSPSNSTGNKTSAGVTWSVE